MYSNFHYLMSNCRLCSYSYVNIYIHHLMPSDEKLLTVQSNRNQLLIMGTKIAQ